MKTRKDLIRQHQNLIPQTCRAEGHLETPTPQVEPGYLPGSLDFAPCLYFFSSWKWVKWKEGTGEATELKMREKLRGCFCLDLTVLGIKVPGTRHPPPELLLPSSLICAGACFPMSLCHGAGMLQRNTEGERWEVLNFSLTWAHLYSNHFL